MGNFSISHYAGITIEGHFVEVRYFIDMAEIPTFQEIQQNSIVAQSNDPRVQSYLSSQAEAFKTNLLLTLNGQPLKEGDGAAISGEKTLSLAGAGPDGGELLLFDLP